MQHEVNEYEKECTVAIGVQEFLKRLDTTLEGAVTDSSDTSKAMQDKYACGMVVYGLVEEINCF